MRSLICFIILAIFVIPSIGLSSGDFTKSVIKIVTIETNSDYNSPWTLKAPARSSGSGCLISGNKILTNAHVVSNGSYITVQSHGQPKKYKATVSAISHDADLALLTVENQAFFKGLIPLKLGELPRTSEQVTVYGYPEGGESLSTTTGVISRIEHTEYPHSLLNMLAIQVDAAINNGNSGGPALVDGKIAGISMASQDDSDNIAYLVPAPVVRHFITDIEDGTYHGFPALGIRIQEIENDAMRAFLKMSPTHEGALVTHVIQGFATEINLQKNDVLLSLGAYKIGNDAKIEIAPSIRTDLKYAVEYRHVGDTVNIKVLRNGKKITLQVRLENTLQETILLPYEWDSPSRYFIFGGLVFIPATSNLIDLYINEERISDGFRDLAHYHSNNYKQQLNQEIVMLSHVMPDIVNEGYQALNDRIIVSVNGHKIENMTDLIRIIKSTIEGAPVIFRTTKFETIVLSKMEAVKANKSILKQYGIPRDRSANYDF